jgi:hypothetical protein
MNDVDGQMLERTPTSVGDRLAAYVGLIAVDVLLKTRGYASVRRRLASCPTAKLTNSDKNKRQAQIVAAVDWAIVYYTHEVLCLQRCAVITWLLRKRGIPAQMIIGYQPTPVKAHAWVEVDRAVVSDTSSVIAPYLEMERI